MNPAPMALTGEVCALSNAAARVETPITTPVASNSISAPTIGPRWLCSPCLRFLVVGPPALRVHARVGRREHRIAAEHRTGEPGLGVTAGAQVGAAREAVLSPGEVVLSRGISARGPGVAACGPGVAVYGTPS